jgi:hypothetical protein
VALKARVEGRSAAAGIVMQGKPGRYRAQLAQLAHLAVMLLAWATQMQRSTRYRAGRLLRMG